VQCPHNGRLPNSLADAVDTPVNAAREAAGEVLDRDPVMKLMPVCMWD
jgi:hypothetical protein